MPTVRLNDQSEEEFVARFLYEMYHLNHDAMARSSILFWEQLKKRDRLFWNTKATQLLEGLNSPKMVDQYYDAVTGKITDVRSDPPWRMILGLDGIVTREEIKLRTQELLLRVHPDVSPHLSKDEAKKKTQEIIEARAQALEELGA